MDEWYATAQDEGSDEGCEESIPLESDGFPVGTESPGRARHFGICTYNVGGYVNMSRFREILTAIKNDLDTWTKTLPHVVIFSEFRVASGYANKQYELIVREMFYGEYYLLLSPPTMRRSVVYLGSVDVALKKPAVKVLIPGYVMSVKVFARYVVGKMRQEIAEVWDPLIHEGCIVCSDFNSTTCSHDKLNDLDGPTARHDNIWPWLRNLEGNGKITEVFKEAWGKSQMQDTVLMTRVRHYAGSSYIARMYVT